jgi:hypothetical protein
VIANLRDALSAGLGSAVDGSALTDGDIVAYLDVGYLPVELEVLGDGADYGAGEYLTMLSYLDIGEYGCVGMYFGIVAYLDIGVDEGIGAYFNMLA